MYTLHPWKRKLATVLVPALVLTVGLAAPSAAAAKAGQMQAVEAAMLAQQLAQYGWRVQSPEALAVAAQILLDNEAQPFGGEKEHKPDRESADVAQLEPEELLAAAAELAFGRPGCLALVQQLQKRLQMNSRGRIPGPMIHRDRIASGDDDVYNITFRGGEVAIVRVVGEGTTNLDLRVYDENDRLVGEDTGPTDRCSAIWKVSGNKKYRIRITNLGDGPNTYTLATN